MASNRGILINRIREASRKFYAAVEEARLAVSEFNGNGGSTYTDPFFYVNENVNGSLRTDLDITKEQLVGAEVSLNALSNVGTLTGPGGATINDYLPALSKVKTGQ